MARDELLAKRYAKGLAEEAEAAGTLEEARRDLRLLADLLDPRTEAGRDSGFGDFLASPLHSPAEKAATSERILKELGVGETAAGFFGVLIGRNRVRLLPEILVAFGGEAGRLTGQLTAVVQTARPLTADQADRLAHALTLAMGQTVHIHQRVEPGLLAGAKVTIGDRTFDGSVLGRLEGLKRRLQAGEWVMERE